MADDLNRILQSTKTETAAPEVTVPKPAPKGDDLIRAANEASDLTPEEKRHVKLFQESKELLDRRFQEDSAYAEVTLPKLEKMTGADLADFVIDEADKLKIDYLKRHDPKFTSSEAASASFFNDVALGQGMRVLRGLGQAVDKASEMTGGAIKRGNEEVPLEDVLDRKREEFRLLQKAFPTADLAGKLGALVAPGSPLKMLFSGGAKAGASLSGAVLSRLSKNPGLFQKALQGGTSLGTGSAAIGGVQGYFGADDDLESLDRAAGEAGKGFLMGALIGSAIPVGAAAAEKVANVASPYVARAVEGGQNFLAKGVEKLTNVPASAIRAYNKNSGAIRSAAGSESRIGRELDEFISSATNSKLPEVQAAEKLLPELPAVDASKMLSYLRSIKSPSPGEAPAAEKLREWATWAENQITAQGGNAKAVPAPAMRNIIEKMQEFARSEYGRESNLLLDGIKQAAHIARRDLVETAVSKGGQNGALYRDLMMKAAEKRKILGFVRKQLGTHPEVIEKRSEAFISRLFGPNKEIVLKRMEALDSKFGTNFVEQAQNALHARQLGPNGIPPWFTKHQTGAALLGAGTGYAVDGPKGAAIGLALSSPRMGAKVIGMSDKVSGVARAMFSDPKALAEVARYGGVPFEVRTLAKEIQTALIKDGPMSAGSVLRLAADTPYFVGLVNAFDVAKKRGAKSARHEALEQANEIANRRAQQPPQPQY